MINIDNNRQFYKAYGLTFSATFQIPEFRKSNVNVADIQISFGEVPQTLENESSIGALWTEANGQYLCDLKGIARFLIDHSSSILIEKYPKTNEHEIRKALLGSILGVTLLLRKQRLFCASAVQTKNGAVMFMGNAGSGRSTLLAAFLQNGGFMLSDDKTSLVLADKDVIQIVPGMPVIRITEDAVKKLDLKVNKRTFEPDFGKYCFNTKRFKPHNVDLKAIYYLQLVNDVNLEFTPLNQFSERHAVLNTNRYFPMFDESDEYRTENFKFITEVARLCQVTTIKLSSAANSISEIVKRIEGDLAK